MHFYLLNFSITFSFLSFGQFAANAQCNYNNWHFGEYAGVTFNSGNPVAFGNSAMLQLEGCASESSALSGALKFYTNGIQVWDRNNTLMPNGIGLFGHQSSAQSALIVPKPLDTNNYYIFTVSNFFTNGSPGAHFSTVDMNLNGGFGDVAVKNGFLMGPCSEKLVATQHANNIDYWILVHSYSGTQFFAYPLTNLGIGTPVISSCNPSFSNFASIGCMKLSPDGSKLAVARSGETAVVLYNFDRFTGAVSGPLYSIGPVYTSNLLYGVAFSPNGKLLYVTVNNNGDVYQYNLALGNQAAIIASKVVVGTAPGVQYFRSMGMQLGPDKKLYIVSDLDTNLATIEEPDSIGIACNYNPTAVLLGTNKVGHLGLPNCIETMLAKRICLDDVCISDTAQFNSFSTDGVVQSYWNFGDSNSISNTDSGFSSSHLYSAPGVYQVQQIKIYANGIVDTILGTITVFSIPTIQLPSDTLLCLGDSINLIPNTNASTYLWQNGSTNSTLMVNSQGTYIVTVTDSGCVNSDTCIVSYQPCSLPVINLASSDTLFCEKQAIDFYDLSQNNPTSWQWTFSGAVPSSSTLQNPTGIYYSSYGSFDVTLIACNAAGCDSLHFPNFITELAQPPAPVISMNYDTLFSSFAYGYQWFYNGNPIANATANYYIPLVNGNYYVVISDSVGCINSSNVITLTNVGIAQHEASTLHIIPNPTTDVVHIYLPQPREAVLSIVVTDIAGHALEVQSKRNVHGTIILSLQHYAQGTYMVTITTPHANYKGMVIKK